MGKRRRDWPSMAGTFRIIERKRERERNLKGVVLRFLRSMSKEDYREQLLLLII